MEKKILPYLVIISALSVSLSAAYYSVTGIGHMFSGQKENVMIMMTTLEISKLVLASLVYQYWNKLALLLKTYYIIAVLVLMVITSGGIYGYLSGAYTETKSSLGKQNIEISSIDRKISSIDIKLTSVNRDLESIDKEKVGLNNQMSSLRTRLSSQNQRVDTETGQVLNTSISLTERRSLEKEIESINNYYKNVLIKKEEDLSSQRNLLLDSISKLDFEKNEIELNSDISSELGPLIYLSELTGKSMDSVINWFIIALMLVFDPLAVSLVIGANIIFKSRRKEDGQENIYKNEDLKKSIEEKEKSLSELENTLTNLTEKKESLDSDIKESLEEVEKRKKDIKKLEDSIEDLKMRENEKIENILTLNQNLLNLEKQNSLTKKASDGPKVEELVKSEELVKNSEEDKSVAEKPINKKQMMRKK